MLNLNGNLTATQDNNHLDIANAPTCAALANGNNILQDFITIQAEIDREDGIYEYIDEQTGNIISYDDYWAKKRFESQPFYILGKLARVAVDNICHQVSSMASQAFSQVNYVIDYVNWMNSDTRSIDDAILTNDLSMLRAFSEHPNRYVREYLKNALEDLSSFDRDLYAQYKKLSTKIDQAIKEAQRLNKPLMILIGENHYDRNALLAEDLILHILAEKQISKLLLTEAFFKQYYLDISENPVANHLEDEAKSLGFNKVPMDYAACGHIHFIDPPECESTQHNYKNSRTSTSVEGMKVRNEVMVDVAIASKGKDPVIAIVGICHVDGMLLDTPLVDHYHILPLSTVDRADQQCQSYTEEPIDTEAFRQMIHERKNHPIHNQIEKVLLFSNHPYAKKLYATNQIMVQKAREIHKLSRNTTP
ncbi:hypothetical protein [Candidatus Berkiella aquae]|uniref:Uncharacterized protein n=1 Tax=Candidatus Berkiella aquae TaxID=295108 RepID=A0A0Q9YCZ9_9GAMM|nr:hypothetical protein [Candidatus Berkiella aquae]MCS5709907.1 hypothetical protein [Candidatus Berkiella aquae]